MSGVTVRSICAWVFSVGSAAGHREEKWQIRYEGDSETNAQAQGAPVDVDKIQRVQAYHELPLCNNPLPEKQMYLEDHDEHCGTVT
jgi:hypothetical protein